MKELLENGTSWVGESPVSIECRLVDEIKAGNHYLMVGEAVNVKKRRESKGLYQGEGGTG